MLYVCHQIVDKLEVPNVLLSEGFVVKIVSHAVNVLLDEEKFSLCQAIRLSYLKDTNNVS